MIDPVHAETGVDATTMAFGAVAAMLARQPFNITLPVPGRPRNWPLPMDKRQPSLYRPLAILEYIEETLRGACQRVLTPVDR